LDFKPNAPLHPVLNIFRGEENSGLDTAPIYTYYQVEVAPDSAWVLEKPFVVRLGVHRFGRTRAPEAVVARAGPSQVGFRTQGDVAGPQTFVVGRDPWNREAMRRDVFTHGLWQFQPGTGNFAWAGIDMALWDVCGRACGEPIWRLLGGLQQKEATYFYYLARGTRESLATQVDDGLEAGFGVFYLKVGLEAGHLAAERVPARLDVEKVEVVAVEHDQSRTRTQDGGSRKHEVTKRTGEALALDAERHRGRFAAGDHERV